MTLPEVFDITTVREQHGRLRAALVAGAAVRIDASQVARTDAAAMQLLIAAVREAATRNIPLRLHDAAPALVDVAAVLGASAILGLDDAVAAQ
jgi:ABC-type transporter Mla MlaB component